MSKIHELAFNAEEIDELLDSVEKKTIYQDATQSEHGLMSTTDKTKLNSLPTAQQIDNALDAKVDKEAGKGLSKNDYTDAEKAKVASALQTETDPTVPSWAKQQNKPSYDYSEIGNTPDLSGFITKSVNDLANYYLKSETYTQAEVNALIGAIQQFHYEIYATLPQTGQSNVLYLIGPTGSGSDKYEEYVYSNSAFTKIGDTSIDLRRYVTTGALNKALSDYTTTANLTTLLAGKQDTISDLATIRSGAALGATAYQKPLTGIPASDIASGVIPTVPVQNVTVGGTSVLSNGVAVVPAIPTVPTISTNIASDATSDTKTTSPKAVKTFVEGKGYGTYSKPQDGIPESDLSSDVQQALQKHFKGWYDSSSNLPDNPVVGDYAYVKGATSTDPAVIYECTTNGSWSNSGRTADTSNVQTFADGQEVNEVHIVNDLTTGGTEDVLSAEQGVVLAISSALNGCKGYKSEHAGVNTMSTIATFNLKAGVKYQLRVKASSVTPSGYNLVNRVYKADGTTSLMSATLTSGNTESISTVYDCQEDLSGCIFKSETRSDFEWEIIVADFLADNAITTTKIADNAITTTKIADNAVTISKVSDYTKDVLLDGFLSGSNKDYNPYVKECYIDPKYLANGAITSVALRSYGNGMIIRAFKINASWSMVDYAIFNNKNNGDIIHIVVTNAGDGVVVGTTVGYIIFSDIAGFKAQAPDNGNGQKFVLGLCTKLFTQYNIYDYLKRIPGNAIPDGVVTEQKIANGAVSLQKTTGVSSYEGVYISIPDNITATVDDKIQIFFKSIVNCADISAFDVIAVCSYGKSYPRYWEYTPVAENAGNTATITIRVRDNALNTIVEKSATISFVNKMTAPSTNKNVLCIGASATSNGVWVGELKRRLTENTGDGTPANPNGLGLSNITFVGRKRGSSVNVPLEATGGWKVQSYASQGETAFRMQVSGVTQLHIGDSYTSPHGGVFVLQEINVTEGVGNIRFTFNSAIPTIPSSGTLTRTSGTGDSTITYSSYEEETFSPFWNDSLERLDFTTYANDWCNGSIDVMIWHCGVNDIMSGSSYAASITNTINAFKDILRQYHIDFPSGKVIISSVPTCSQNGGMAANYGASSSANTFTFSNSARQYALALSELCADSEFSSFAFYASVLEEFDSENNYPSTDAPVNNRLTSVTEKVGTNGVHPLDVGSLQVADGVYRTFNTL